MSELISILSTIVITAAIITRCGLPADPKIIEQATLQCQPHGGVQLYWTAIKNEHEVECKDGVTIEFKVK